MVRSIANKGMTLIELMAVIAIIALLGTVMAFFVTGNRGFRAQSDLSNDVMALMQAQRSRASAMGVATYVNFNNLGAFNNGFAHSALIVPKIGKESTCLTSNRQLPILYTDGAPGDDTNINTVAISINADKADCKPGSGSHFKDGGCRSLDAQSDNRYAGNVALALRGNDAAIETNLTVCFQPNGQVRFYSNGDWRTYNYTKIRVAMNGLEENRTEITISATGEIYWDKT